MCTTITLDFVPPNTGRSPAGPCGVTLTVCIVFGPTDTTVAGAGVRPPLTEAFGALMVFTVTTRGPVPFKKGSCCKLLKYKNS